jgi:hypothetical protein
VCLAMWQRKEIAMEDNVSLHQCPIYRWLLTGDRMLVLTVVRLLVSEGSYARANKLLYEATVWGIL